MSRILGASMTPFGRFGDETVRSLAERAVAGALGDAEITADQVQIVFFANAVAGLLTGQEMIRGQAALRHTGLLGAPIVNVENACASATSAFFLACMAVEAGAADVALAVGSERLTHPDKRRTVEAIATAVDLLEPPTAGMSGFMDVYAGMAAAYADRTGATVEDFARVAVKNSRHGALNPNAHHGKELTVEQVLDSRVIAPPLTLLMCCPVSDGAAAVVVCSERYAREHGGAPVRVRACTLRSGQDRADGVAEAARSAYEQSGCGPSDVDVVELHDGAAPAELITLEQLALAGEGEAPGLLADGVTALGGRMPVNPSGGLLARGHPIGATGCAQLVELTDQLRGRAAARQVPGARVALAENAGGYLENDSAAITVTVLST
jgi:acetyl-CoA acetyltransferase